MRDSELSANTVIRRSKHLVVNSLMDWVPDQGRALSALLEGLKGGYLAKDFEDLAREFQLRRLQKKPCSQKLIFVPAPSKSGKADHAEAWARALQGAVGGDLRTCLKKRSSSEQKALSRQERELISFESSENFSTASCRVIFADDIVTSGATAWAAYNALGEPPFFEVWSIAYRHLATSGRV